ncbi:MAG: hypothetical protein H0W25_05770 [Acidimicrobiia bacterium]|nr:hypothetical protein [Acidimicrobiia bacterium]
MLLAPLLATAALTVGWAVPAHATTARQLDVVLVTQLTDWSVSFPQGTTYTGSGVGTDQQLWDFTETYTFNHGSAFGTFSMQAGADSLSGRVQMTPRMTPFIQVGTSGDWAYTVTEGRGAYAGCTGLGTGVKEGVTTPSAPPTGVAASEISFDLTCP